ncbi:hypothetical protein [Streptomyces sp. NPDC059631]|uniref:hypothetical protein n=1 Tax=unclassified Streptomyces TaxID=2593676 RepID=UPI0036AB9820
MATEQHPHYWEETHVDDSGQITELDEITPEDRSAIVTAAVTLFDEHGDEDDILSSRQLDVLAKLAPLAQSATAQDLAAMDLNDLDTILTTAVELVDKHGIDSAELDDAVSRNRHLTALDNWQDEDE